MNKAEFFTLQAVRVFTMDPIQCSSHITNLSPISSFHLISTRDKNDENVCPIGEPAKKCMILRFNAIIQYDLYQSYIGIIYFFNIIIAHTL